LRNDTHETAVFSYTQQAKKAPIYHLYIIALALLPVLISMLAGFIGYCMRCNINEAGTDQCVRIGIPFGAVLNPLGVLGWLCIITIPLGLVATVILAIVAIHDTLFHRNNNL